MKIRHILTLFLSIELVLASLTVLLAFRLGEALGEARRAQDNRF